MVLAGLVIALGEVVDDAIIDVENIARRLRLNRQLPEPGVGVPRGPNASLEVRSAVVYATLIVVLVFLPVFFLDGLAGTFFRPLAKAYVLAILASLLVALTVTPALSLMLLGGRTRERPEAPADPAGSSGSTGPSCRPWSPGRGRPSRSSSSRSPSPGLATLTLGQEFLPNFQETRLPDALGREAGHRHRGQPPHHRPGEQGTAADPRRAQLRLAHRPGRGRRRSRSARTSPSSGSASTRTSTTQRRWRRSKTSSTAIPACTATCRPT